jgi:hypothetical protein
MLVTSILKKDRVRKEKGGPASCRRATLENPKCQTMYSNKASLRPRPEGAVSKRIHRGSPAQLPNIRADLSAAEEEENAVWCNAEHISWWGLRASGRYFEVWEDGRRGIVKAPVPYRRKCTLCIMNRNNEDSASSCDTNRAVLWSIPS